MIPVNQPLLSNREKDLLIECIDTGWISSDGPFIKEFETQFSTFIGTDFGIAVSSGSAALETAIYAAGLVEGDEIIIPTFTIISCALAAIRLGVIPVLVDVEPATWNMDVSQIESNITSKTKAIMPVHIYGHPVEMGPLLKIAEKYNLIVIEDAAEAHGAQYLNKKCGSMGDISAFSFYANKIITTGEGGMVLTSNPVMAERARSYRNLCFIPEKRFLHHELGFNYRMTNLQAAVGVAQVERIDEFIHKKRINGAYYKKKLKNIKGVKFQIEKKWAMSVYWMYCIELEASLGVTAEELMKRLSLKQIGTRPFFRGLHAQPALHKIGLFIGEKYPVTETISKYGLYLPSGMALTTTQIDQVVDAVASNLNI